jgi:hypothetical protein
MVIAAFPLAYLSIAMKSRRPAVAMYVAVVPLGLIASASALAGGVELELFVVAMVLGASLLAL